jgi:hypothetical protein
VNREIFNEVSVLWAEHIGQFCPDDQQVVADQVHVLLAVAPKGVMVIESG